MKKSTIIRLVIIFFLSIALRFNSLQHPFWVDEFSTADQARLLLTHGLDVFSQAYGYFEHHNITTHLLTALSFSLLGASEFSARLPTLIIGSLIPVLVFFVCARLYDSKVAWSAALLSIFSYFQITWSHQARGYMLQQFFVLLTIYFYYQLMKEKSNKLYIFGLIGSCLLGLLTHTTFILIIVSLLVHFILFNFENLKTLLLSRIMIFSIIVFAGVAVITGLMNMLWATAIGILQNGLVNNVWYYHSFLWREHTLISFLAVLGIAYGLKDKKYRNYTSLLIIMIGAYLAFVCLLFAPYVSRYILPIFPLLLILVGKAISESAKTIFASRQLVLVFVITMFIVANGDTFTLKPKSFYSVNHFMREVAVLDYDAVYDRIQTKGNLADGQTAVIDTWPDRLKWYLGPNQDFYYIFRWLNEPGLVNGLPKATPFNLNPNSEKVMTTSGTPPLKLIGELSDLEKAMQKYPNGFIWIDDTSMSAEVIDYVETNFHKELFLDHYTLDDNPYSIWPGTLYSWGFETPNPFYDSAVTEITLGINNND